MRAEWEQFVERLGPQAPLRSIIVESWERCRLTGMRPGDLALRRVSADELARRQERDAALLAVGAPHLEWLLLSTGALKPVAVMLTDRDGVILASSGNVPEMLVQHGLLPGYDWSEQSMGTNGIGTAITAGQPVAILGPEHFLEAIHDYTCVGAPIQAADGTVLGAVDVCTSAKDGDPSRLVLAAYAARAIAKELKAGAGMPRSLDGDLLAVAAHEMKTPLTTLLVLAQALRQAAEQTVLPLSAVDRFEKQVQRLVAMTTDILDVAQLKAQQTAEVEEVELCALVRGIARTLEETGLDESEPRLLQVHAPQPVVGCWAPQRLQPIVTNLLSNALKYGDGKPVDVLVERDGTNARLVVRDQGVGVPAAERERIFQRFGRGSSTARRFPGNGLGLWIASELASSMGGRVELDPAAERGTTFVVTLPLGR